MPNSYSKYTYQDVQNLGIKLISKRLFEKIEAVIPSENLIKSLEINLRLPLATEKAKSELLVVPILNELYIRNPETFNYFSGYNFDVDKKNGLKGHCDFLLSMSYFSPIIEAPVVCIVEAKNADMELGIPQCIAQMYASQLFNKKQEKQQEAIYGIVTIGQQWLFLRLDDKTVYQDINTYYLNQLPELLGVFQWVINFYKNK